MGQELEHIKQRLDCRQVAQSYGVEFKRRQGQWWITSCIHKENHKRGDRNPSFSMGKDGYKCFGSGCGISGDVFDLLAFFEDLDPRDDFPKIVELAAQLAGVELELHQPRPQRPWARDKRRVYPHFVRSALIHKSSSASAIIAPQASDYARHFQPKRREVLKLHPEHPRLKLMSQLWALLHDAPLGPEALGWLDSRAIDPDIAYAYGCRDFSARRDEILELIERVPAYELEQSGLSSEEGKLWAGLRALKGERWANGIAIPQLHPGWLRAPLAWRWRLVNPITTTQGRVIKAIAQYGGVPSVPVLPLGAAPPTAQALDGLARWPALVKDVERPDYVVVVCEGEPDFLSIAQASAALELGLYVVPLGVLAMSAGMPEEGFGLLSEAQQIICVMDKGQKNAQGKTGGELIVDQIRGRLLDERRKARISFEQAYREVDKIITPALRDDDDDVNDLHRRGELQGWLASLLKQRA